MREVAYVLAWTNLGLELEWLEGNIPSEEWRYPSEPAARAMMFEMDSIEPSGLSEELNSWFEEIERKDKDYVKSIWPDIAEFMDRNNLW